MKIFSLGFECSLQNDMDGQMMYIIGHYTIRNVHVKVYCEDFFFKWQLLLKEYLIFARKELSYRIKQCFFLFVFLLKVGNWLCGKAELLH